MPSSSKLLRQATKLVADYLKVGSHHVNMCTKPLDSDDWYIEFKDVLKMNREDAQKLYDRASRAEEQGIKLLAEIERIAEGFFYRHIYRSENYRNAYFLLDEFLINVVSNQKYIAKQRLELIDVHYGNNSSKSS